MPRVKRWFPVSQDINADPDVWDLTITFGDRALRVWLEILAIADRNDGVVPGQFESVCKSLANRCGVRKDTIKRILIWCKDRGWIDFEEVTKIQQRGNKEVSLLGLSWAKDTSLLGLSPVIRVRNYVKYHNVGGKIKNGVGITTPSPPILSYPKEKKEKKEILKERRERREKEEKKEKERARPTELSRSAQSVVPKIAYDFIETNNGSESPSVALTDEERAILEAKEREIIRRRKDG